MNTPPPHSIRQHCEICGKHHEADSFLSLHHAHHLLREKQVRCIDDYMQPPTTPPWHRLLQLFRSDN